MKAAPQRLSVANSTTHSRPIYRAISTCGTWIAQHRYGFYLGYYGVESDDTTLAFPVNSQGQQTSDVPISITDNLNNINILYGVYLQDIWTINEQLTLTAGVRFDGVSGIIDNNMISPRINLLYKINPDTALHAGFARYFQTPDFATIPQKSSRSRYHCRGRTGRTAVVSREGLLLGCGRAASLWVSSDRDGERLLSPLAGLIRFRAIGLCADFGALGL